MDPVTVAAAGLGGSSGLGTFIAFLRSWKKDSELQKKDADLSAELKALNARIDAANSAIMTGKADFSAIPALISEKMERLAEKIEQRLDKQDEEIAKHAVLDAQTYVTKPEHRELVAHTDDKFTQMGENMDEKIDGIRVMIVDLIKDSAGKKKR
jgi:hypothetical protein